MVGGKFLAVLAALCAALAAFATGWRGLLGAVLAVLLTQLQQLVDCCDGEVARWRGTSSPLGVYLDRVGHYVAECGIAVALGIRVTGSLQLSGVWISAGLLLGLLALLGYVAIAAGARPITNNATGRPDTNTIIPVLFDQQFPAVFAGIAFAAI